MSFTIAQLNRLILGAIALAVVCVYPQSVAVSAPEQTTEPEKSTELMGVLDPDYRAITQHKLKLETKTLSYMATAGSLTVRDNKAEPLGRIFISLIPSATGPILSGR